MEYSGYLSQILVHPEPISYGLLHVSNYLFGRGNGSFFFMFIISFSILAIGAWRILQEKSALFILLIASSSILLTIYGNAIRQALSISLLILAISFTGRKFTLSLTASFLSHLSTAFLFPFIIFLKSKKLTKTKIVIPVLLASSLLSFLIPAVLDAFKSSEIHILAQKSSTYEDWEQYDTFKTKIMFYVLLTIMVAANHFKRLLTKDITNRLQDAYQKTWALVICTSSAMLLTQSYDKIFERYYSVFFVLSSLYICLYISTVKKPYFRIFFSSILAFYSLFSISKNISSATLFYCTDPSAFLRSSMFGLFNCL